MEYDDEVTLANAGEEPVDAMSALLTMTLGAEYGDAVEISSENPAAVEAIADLVAQDMDA